MSHHQCSQSSCQSVLSNHHSSSHHSSRPRRVRRTLLLRTPAAQLPYCHSPACLLYCWSLRSLLKLVNLELYRQPRRRYQYNVLLECFVCVNIIGNFDAISSGHTWQAAPSLTLVNTTRDCRCVAANNNSSFKYYSRSSELMHHHNFAMIRYYQLFSSRRVHSSLE